MRQSKVIINDVLCELNQIPGVIHAEYYGFGGDLPDDALPEAGVQYGDVVHCHPLLIKWSITEQDAIMLKIRSVINDVLRKYKKTDNKNEVGLIGDGFASEPWYVVCYDIEFMNDDENKHHLELEITLQIDWSSF